MGRKALVRGCGKSGQVLFGRQGLSARNSGENWANGVEIREWEWGQADIAWAHYSELQVRQER